MSNVWNIINTKIGIAIITAIVSVVVTMVCQIIYLRFKRRVSFEKVIGNKITNALESVRDIELSVKAIEIYGIDELLEESEVNIDFFEQDGYYPAIMASADTFFKFFNQINEVRGDYEKYLNYRISSYLFYMERYSMNVMKYAVQNSIQFDLLGTVLLFDFQNWQKRLDKELVKLLNKTQYKIYSQNGHAWERSKEKTVDDFWKNSILFRIMNGDASPEIIAAKAIIFNDSAAEEMVSKLK